MTDCNQIEYQELLDLSADGALDEVEMRRLQAHLDVCPSCRTERVQLLQLGEVLRAARVDVDPDFQERVVAALRPTGWEARSPRSWVWAVALCAGFGATAAILAGLSAARLTPTGSFVSALTAVLGLFKASILAGSGLLGASWRGLSLGLHELLAGSPANLVALGALVVGCNLVFFRLWQGAVVASERRRTKAASGRDRRERASG